MFVAMPVYSMELVSLDDALRATYTACVGIDEQLTDLKKMAGINTAVTSVGVASGLGATVTGFVKASKDKQIAEIEKLIAEIDDMQKKQNADDLTDEDKNLFLMNFAQGYNSAVSNLENYQSDKDKLTKQSKNLGNWRTGLLAGSATTNIAGAVIAGTNKADADLQTQINNCRMAVDNLRGSMIQARIDGIDISEAESIVAACGEYDYVDLSPINKRGRGAMISSTVGAATGLAGTITSAVANTNKTREDDTDLGKQKEKNLNTAANILSVGTTAASATATVFNASQISAIKKFAAVAEKCTGVLK